MELCPHFGVCGGCKSQNIPYANQLQIKRDEINAAFSSAGHAEQIASVLPCPEIFYYRNRMDYVVGWNGAVGLKEAGSWSRYVDLKTCLLLDETAPTILETVRLLMRELKIQPWDAKFYRGLLRYVVIRCGKNTCERMITLIVHDLKLVDEKMRAEITRHLAPLCTTLYLGENPEITDLSLAKALVLLHGNEYLTEEVNGLRYRIHPNSFFQTNTLMAAELQNIVLSFLPVSHFTPAHRSFSEGGLRVSDLYCGLGFFGIACAKRGAAVFAQEIDENAIILAKQNAELNGVSSQMNFVAAAVENLDWQTEKPDVVILDPPRSGLHPRVIKTILEKQPPHVIYVSCNYKHLAEELKQFKSIYRVERLAALDLFPHTPHVEVVVKLSR